MVYEASRVSACSKILTACGTRGSNCHLQSSAERQHTINMRTTASKGKSWSRFLSRNTFNGNVVTRQGTPPARDAQQRRGRQCLRAKHPVHTSIRSGNKSSQSVFHSRIEGPDF